MSAVKLVYFDIRARGEPVRMVLAAAGQKFEDERITFEKWPGKKSESPYGQLPYVEMKGKRFAQSVALATYFAREHGLYGKTNLDALRIDEVVNFCQDMVDAVVKVKFEKDAAKKAELGKKLEDETGPKFLGIFQKMLKENGDTGFFVGSAVTLAEIFLYCMLEFTLAEKPELEKAVPDELKKMRTAVQNHPLIKEYLARRKESPF